PRLAPASTGTWPVIFSSRSISAALRAALSACVAEGSKPSPTLRCDPMMARTSTEGDSSSLLSLARCGAAPGAAGRRPRCLCRALRAVLVPGVCAGASPAQVARNGGRTGAGLVCHALAQAPRAYHRALRALPHGGH
nr:hypothetical protein [Tanacetum cinerariifolium]